MIAPMNKYTFLVFHQEYDAFLKKIQDVGIVHVIEKEKGDVLNDELNAKINKANTLKKTIKLLEKRNTNNIITQSSIKHDVTEILNEVNTNLSAIEANHQKLGAVKKDLKTTEPWGEFTTENLKKLAEAGYQLHFFNCPERKFDASWNQQYTLEIINETNAHIFFVIISKQNENIDIDAEYVTLPSTSVSELRQILHDTEKNIEQAESKLNELALNGTASLKNELQKTEEEINFVNVKLNSESSAENSIMILEGWVPCEKEQEIQSVLEKETVYFEAEKAKQEDKAPILLKNNKFAKLFEPIGELYTFPDYKELDLIPFFAPFYMLFFGFCLGDAGYGLLITIGTIIGLTKASPKIKPLLKLGMFLGISTTIMGIIGGTFFGIMLHPNDYTSTYELAPWIKKYQEFILSSDNLMYLALGLGYVQVLFGMFLNAANRYRLYGFKYALSQLGWNIIVLVTLPAFALGKAGVIPTELASKIAVGSGIVGGLPALFYNSPGKNPLLNLGTGLWEAYGVASGLLGDVLSYIRLFALGLSSAILGNVFNQLAIDSGKGVHGLFGILIMVLILAFGHGLNFFMAVLGSFVHPLRLTFVEFYKNAGFMGGGKKYDPFRRK